MAFHDVRFPDRIAEGAEGGPEFSTSVIVSSGGHEQRQGNWSVGRGRWNVATGLQDDNDLAVLIAFFRARAGRLHAFRFKDWSDYQLDRQLIGTEDRIQAARRFYNNNVRAYNERVQSVPTNLIARLFGFHERTYFNVDEAVHVVDAPPVAFEADDD